jgi:mannose-1-phosphate guanylyltransferase
VEESLDKGPFIATNGDILTGLDLTKIIEAHQGSDALATITLTSVEDSTAYGLVEADHQLRVQRFVEKPGSDEVNTSLINAGIYVLEREVLSMIPQGQETSLEREIFPELQAMGKLHAYISSSYWRDIGTPRSYLAASHDVLSGAIGRDNEFRHTSIDRSARISKGVTLLPPVCIAEDCEIEAGTTIGGRTSMGRRCSIGDNATVEGSILFGGVRVGAEAIIRNSIVGPNVTIQSNAVVRGCSVLGEGYVVGEENVLDHGVRVNPGTCLPSGSVSF